MSAAELCREHVFPEASDYLWRSKFGGMHLTRVLEHLAQTGDLPKAIRTDNGQKFCSRAMLIWAYARGVLLFLSSPASPIRMPASNRSTGAYGMNA